MTQLDKKDSPTLNVIVGKYEQHLRSETPASWMDATTTFLEELNSFCSPRGLREMGYQDWQADHWYTRIAAALTQCVTHPGTTINRQQLFAVSRMKFVVDYIFSASGYRSTAHLISIMATETSDGLVLKRGNLATWLAFVSLNDLPSALLEIALEQDVNILFPLMLGWLNQRAVFTVLGEQNRATLLASGHLIEKAEMTEQYLALVINAWMYCTYADSPNKHNIKTSFNVLLSNLLKNVAIPATELKSGAKLRTRPKVLVIHERFTEVHAMYRCYAPLIRALTGKFQIVALAEAENIDEPAKQLFDTVYEVEEGKKSIPAIVKAILEIAPDIIYYPSLGMSHISVLLAQLRLAPVQIMTHGHPATSMSPEIDYVYLNEADAELAARQSEKVLVGDALGVFAEHVDLPTSLPALALPTDREVRIAVNSKVMKLSHRLLQICKRLVNEAEVPLRFSFFPGERGLLFDGLSQAIRAELPSAEIMPYTNYDTFLQEIAKCDFALAAFPFGNTNSTVDTCLLGLPTVVHYGAESASQTDALVLKTAGYPEWLVCDSDEHYFETALALIANKEKRLSVAADLDLHAVRQKLFHQTDTSKGAQQFADMLWFVYENHAELRSRSQRIIRHGEVVRGQA